MDFSTITAAVDASTVITGIGAIAGVMFTVKVAQWGYNRVMGMLPGAK
jgi:hypothetical protein